MKQFNFSILITTIVFCLVILSVNAQKAILHKINQQALEFSKAKTFKFFTPTLGNQLPNPVSSKILKEKQVLELNRQVVQTLKSKIETNIKLSFTINNEPILLKLFEANIFSDNFELATSTLNSRTNVELDTGLHYWGVVDGKANSLASISIFDDEISGFIAFGGETYILGKMKNQNYHVLYRNTDLSFNNNFSCDVRLPENSVQKQVIDQVNQKRSSTIYCVDIHIEGDYDLYLDFGSSVNATTNYINSLMAQVIILMANDNIDLQVSYVNIWTSTSPYNAASADVGVMLDALRNYGWGRTNGDLVHLITTIGGGGVAYLDVLCSSSYNVGVSNVSTNFNNVPVYSWSVNVIAHELGHNLASPHTHDCNWNGNNTAIDDCGYNYSGGTDGCNGPTPTAGTIMSYCHLYGSIGVDFSLGFGPQPKILIVSTINDLFCLDNCTMPSCADINLNIFFDGFPGQTSWDIQDGNGNVVIDSNGNYSMQGGNTTLNAQIGCLEDGCYTFNIYDAIGNGMCPFQSSATGATTFITPGTLITPGSIVGSLSLVTSPGLCGNYQLTNASGETLVYGDGDFGNTQSTSFCLSGGMLQRIAPKNINQTNNRKQALLFEIKPNIANNIINVLLDVSLNECKLNVYNVSGKQVESIENSKNAEILKLDVSDYVPGTYFIQLENNKASYTKTFIKY